MNNDDFITQTEIGTFFKGSKKTEATSHEIGRWLEESGFRQGGQPTHNAILSGLVSKRACSWSPDFKVFVWRPEIIEILEREGYPRNERVHGS